MKNQLTRYVIQVAAFFVANNHFHKHFYQGPFKKVCFPGLNCYACPLARFSCPVGSLQHFIALRQFPFYVLGFLGFIGILGGRFICGFLCPFGFFQELLYKLRTFKIKLPKIFSYFKYIVLFFLTIIGVYITGETLFCKICPAGTIGGGIPQLAFEPELRDLIGPHFYMKYAGLLLTVIFSILIERPFCRVICPLGALLGLLNKITIFQLKIDPDKCNGCKICYKVCPIDIKVYEIDKNSINSMECIKCLRCKSACPQNAISISSRIGKNN